MYWIQRCYFDGVGHSEAFYRDQTFDIFPENWDIKPSHVPHTYIDLVNGGGKTTWISFLLTIFEPKKDRFIQCVAGRKKGKKYNYNDYFHSQLSTIIIEMVDDQKRRILLGQYHQKRGETTEIEYFICDRPDLHIKSLFEKIPSVGRSQNNSKMQPHTDSIKTARNWLRAQNLEHHTYWRYYKTRNEWREGMTEVGINLQMIDTLITINSEEGGVSHFSKYRSECDFLEKYFACCFPAHDIESLKKTCAQDVHQFNELRVLQERDAFYRELNNKWNDFRPQAEFAKTHSDSLNHIIIDLDELLRDLNAYDQQLKQKINQYKISISELNKDIEIKRNELKLKDNQISEIVYQITHQEYETVKEQISSVELKLKESKNDLIVLEAVSAYKSWEKENREYSRKSTKLDALICQKEEPLIKMLKQARGKAKFIFERKLKQVKELRSKIDDEIKTLSNIRNEEESNRIKFTESISQRQTKLEQYKCDIDSADAELKQLKNQGLIFLNESPEVGYKRLEEEVEQIKRKKLAAKEALATTSRLLEDKKQQHQQTENKLRMANSELILCEERVNQANHNLEQIIIIIQEINITYDPAEAQFIDEILTNYKTDLEQKHETESKKNYSISSQLNRIKDSGHLLLDSTIRKALDSFYEKGLSQEEIWAYPEYLSRLLEDDEQKIASIIDSDPGRFLGLAISDDQALEKVKLVIEKISWSDRPIPINKIHSSVLNSDSKSSTLVLAADDKVIYSEKAWEEQIEIFEKELLDSNECLSRITRELNKIKSVQTKWHKYWSDTGSKWLEIRRSFYLAVQEEKSASHAKEESEMILKNTEETWLQNSNYLTEIQLLEKDAINVFQKINNFISEKWKSRISAKQAFSLLSKEIIDLQHNRDKMQKKIRSTQIELDKLNREKGKQDNSYNCLLSDFSNSTFNNVASISTGTEGISTDIAIKEVSLAEEELKSFHQVPEIVSAKKELQEIESKREKLFIKLNAKKGWQVFEENVIESAQTDQKEIESRLADRANHVTTLGEQLKFCQEQMEEVNTRLQIALNARPRNVSITEDISELRRLKIETGSEIDILQQKLDLNKEKINFYKEEYHNQKMIQSKCISLINIIQTCTLYPADGLVKQISDIDQTQIKVRALKEKYDKYNALYEETRKNAKAAWDSFMRLIDREAALPNEEQKDSIMVQKFRSMSYKNSYNDLYNTTLGLQECLSSIHDTIEKIQRSLDSTVKILEIHLRKAIEFLQATVKVKIPASSPVHPKRAIFKMTERVNKLGNGNLAHFCRMSLEQWIKDGDIPSSSRAHDKLTAFLVQKLIPEGELEIRLIKTSRTQRANYFPINEPVGSDGQLLTSAFLLYMTIAKVRNSDIGSEGYGFMVADNPIGECNADDLVRMQLHMAHDIGVQLIYLTGHKDHNAQSMFDKNIFMGRVKSSDDLKLVGKLKEDIDNDIVWNANLEAPSLLRKEKTELNFEKVQ